MSVNPPKINLQFDKLEKIDFNKPTFSKPSPKTNNIIVNSIDELYKLIDKESILISIESLLGNQDINLNCDNWVDLGMDDLDEIEFIMNLEKNCDILINDDVAELVFSNGPKHLISNIASIKRERVLNEILK